MRLYKYKFSDGSEIEREASSETMEEIKRYCEDHGVELIYNGFHEFMGAGRPSRMAVIGGANSRGDAFKTGYHPALGMEIKSPQHYKDVLKAKGLREVGNEKQTEKKWKSNVNLNKEEIQDLRKQGAEISDREADVLTGGSNE